jgi:hypothetical protein
MKPEFLTTQILEKLGFSDPVDFDVKPDGELVVLDRTYQKYKFSKKDYENLLDEKTLEEVKVSKPYHGAKRGRKPKQVIGHS